MIITLETLNLELPNIIIGCVGDYEHTQAYEIADCDRDTPPIDEVLASVSEAVFCAVCNCRLDTFYRYILD